MTSDDIRHVIVDALRRIAPEMDPATIQSSVSFRDQLDIDSMDFLNFVLALHERFGVDIPEVDYPRLYSLDSATDYLASASTARAMGKPATQTLPGEPGQGERRHDGQG